jgi:hypothetical protein
LLTNWFQPQFQTISWLTLIQVFQYFSMSFDQCGHITDHFMNDWISTSFLVWFGGWFESVKTFCLAGSERSSSFAVTYRQRFRWNGHSSKLRGISERNWNGFKDLMPVKWNFFLRSLWQFFFQTENFSPFFVIHPMTIRPPEGPLLVNDMRYRIEMPR